MNGFRQNAGFTLIELLVVIGIVVILSVVVVLTLNPAELLKQSRDSVRTSDLGTIRQSLALYLVDAATPNLASTTAQYTACYLSTLAGVGTSAAKCNMFSGAGIATISSTTSALYKQINGTGWVPVVFSSMTGGSPMDALPADPANNATYYYGYAATAGLTYEINAILESQKYLSEAATDGGNSSTLEFGSALNL